MACIPGGHIGNTPWHKAPIPRLWLQNVTPTQDPSIVLKIDGARAMCISPGCWYTLSSSVSMSAIVLRSPVKCGCNRHQRNVHLVQALRVAHKNVAALYELPG
jgi:hypothetical protein